MNIRNVNQYFSKNLRPLRNQSSTFLMQTRLLNTFKSLKPLSSLSPILLRTNLPISQKLTTNFGITAQKYHGVHQTPKRYFMSSESLFKFLFRSPSMQNYLESWAFLCKQSEKTIDIITKKIGHDAGNLANEIVALARIANMLDRNQILRILEGDKHIDELINIKTGERVRPFNQFAPDQRNELVWDSWWDERQRLLLNPDITTVNAIHKQFKHLKTNWDTIIHNLKEMRMISSSTLANNEDDLNIALNNISFILERFSLEMDKNKEYQTSNNGLRILPR